MDPDAIKAYLTTNSTHHFTEAFPELLAFATEKFLEEFMSHFSNVNPNEKTPKMIADMITLIPEYDFLTPIIPEILKVQEKTGP